MGSSLPPLATTVNYNGTAFSSPEPVFSRLQIKPSGSGDENGEGRGER